ncbi:MAG: beta-ketoacyl synthase N-terminal-like domain-containing protein, partial [Minicystis sp.]
QAGKRPPTLHADAPIDALAGSPFRLVTEAEPWPADRPRVAAVSAFGFGGNNAHLLVSEDDSALVATSFELKRSSPTIAVVGLGARLGDSTGAAAAARALVSAAPVAARRGEVSVSLDGLRFPPRDLEQTLPQQLLVLEAAREAAQGLTLPRDRSSVLIGMGCDPEVARYGARFRLIDWADRWSAQLGTLASPAWVDQARDAIVAKLEAPGVVGTMPNIPANRINSQLDLAGPSYTVSAEQASGLVALQIAARALAAGEIDAAVVGAVDLSDEPVHRAALAALGLPDKPADAAVAMVLKRLDDARRDGDRVIALLDGEGEPGLLLGDGEGAIDPSPQGTAHAASALVHLAAAAFSLHHGARPVADRGAVPWLGPRVVETRTRVLDGTTRTMKLHADGAPAPLLFEPAPSLHVSSDADRAAVLRALAEGRRSHEGPARLVLVAGSETELATRSDLAGRALEKGGPLPEGIAYQDAPIGGDLAFVFTGAAASYQGMGRELALALPAQVARLAARFTSLPSATSWIFGPDAPPPHALDQLWASAFLCQLHAEISRDLLGVTPQATIGYSSGESNALFAMGVWTDLDAMVAASWASPIFTRDIVGDFTAIRRAFRKVGADGPWKAFSVQAPIAAVREALRGEPTAHLTIVNTVDDVVIGGEASACARVIARLGRERALPLDYEMAAHCPEIEEIHGAWYDLHHRASTAVPDLRIYSAGCAEPFAPNAEAAAAAITAQAIGTLDFPRMIERAYQDGVRVFLEQGPRGLCSGWIKRILGDRPHLAVSLDIAGRSGVRQLANAAAALVAAGVAVNVDALSSALAMGAEPARPTGPTLKVPAHAPPVRLPALEASVQIMPRAPALVPVLDTPPPRAPVIAPAPMVVSAPAFAFPPVAPVNMPLTIPLVAASPQGPSAPAEIMARAGEQLTRLGAIHRDFLDAQAAAHTQFLGMQQRMLAGLLGTYAGIGQAPARPAPPPLLTAPSPLTAVMVTSAPQAIDIVAVPSPVSAPPSPLVKALPGPKFDRAALEILASGKISSVFGPAFADQDGYVRQVRMPMPPLLLADRVTGIDAVHHELGTGTLWTETDVTAESDYLHEGRMPAGIMIEAGQADLLLISWQGIDRLNQGERVYRLLGCELTYHGELPQPGETLSYDIHVDGHANQGDVRLFFFHYDCHVGGKLRLTVRGGQAGFFTARELDESGGILWDARTATPAENAVLDAPAVTCSKRAFSAADVRAFSEGRVVDCFGPGYEQALSHMRTPRIQAGKMLFLREISEFDPQGGPWGRGYLRAEAPIAPDDWYFTGHFLNDPCMPGTLMFEGCVQAMSFYLTALGYALPRDGWRFEPVHGHTIPMRCRGQ